MHEADSIFHTLFRSPSLGGIATTQFVRLGAGTAEAPSGRQQVGARRRMAGAMNALSGHGSPAGPAVRFVPTASNFSPLPYAARTARAAWPG